MIMNYCRLIFILLFLPFVRAWNKGVATVLVGVGGILLTSMHLTGLGVFTPSATSAYITNNKLTYGW